MVVVGAISWFFKGLTAIQGFVKHLKTYCLPPQGLRPYFQPKAEKQFINLLILLAFIANFIVQM
jgi:hypothetical protein